MAFVAPIIKFNASCAATTAIKGATTYGPNAFAVGAPRRQQNCPCAVQRRLASFSARAVGFSTTCLLQKTGVSVAQRRLVSFDIRATEKDFDDFNDGFLPTGARNRRRGPNFEDQFDEDFAPASILQEVSNSQLRKIQPGEVRNRALFDSPNQMPRRPRDSGMPRFRLDKLKQDNEMTSRHGILEFIIKEGRKDREDQLQDRRKRAEKELALRAKDNANIRAARPTSKRHSETSGKAQESSVPASNHAEEHESSSEVAALEQGKDKMAARSLEVQPKEGPQAEGRNEPTPELTFAVPNPREMFRLAGNFDAKQAELCSRAGEDEQSMFLAKRLSDAETSESVLAALPGRFSEITAENAAFALNKLASFPKSQSSDGFIRDDSRMNVVLKTLQKSFNQLPPGVQIDLLVAAVTLGLEFRWTDQLLANIESRLLAVETPLMVRALIAVTQMSKAKSVTGPSVACLASLKASILNSLQRRKPIEIRALPPLGVTSICGSLEDEAKEQRRKLLLSRLVDSFRHIVHRTKTATGTFRQTSDVATCLKAFGAASLVDDTLLGGVSAWVRSQPEPWNMAPICRSLSHVGKEQKEAMVVELLSPWLIAFTANPKVPFRIRLDAIWAFRDADTGNVESLRIALRQLCSDVAIDSASASAMVTSLPANERDALLQILAEVGLGTLLQILAEAGLET